VAGGELPAPDEARIARAARAAARFTVLRAPIALRRLRDWGQTPMAEAGDPPSALAGREVGVLSALAHPRSLRETVQALGGRVIAERSFGDHHLYRAGDLSGLAAQAPLWITSEKDAVKLDPAWCGGADVRVLALETSVAEPEEFLAWLETGLA
jgi:tetraacyldisaccharide 4'-kinase